MWGVRPEFTNIFPFLEPLDFLPVFMIVHPSDPMGIRHERHEDTKSCSQPGDKVQAERFAHINIFAGV